MIGGGVYLLDTNIVSYWMRGDAAVIARIRSHSPSEMAMSAITFAEILYGIEKSPVRKNERTRKITEIASLLSLYPFEEQAARHYAVIRSRLETEGLIIGERDLQIAAIASANAFSLVTHNTREFSRIPDLAVEDWA
ncbi:MAG: PIN domain-containing protein [Pseudomonadota bacterium]